MNKRTQSRSGQRLRDERLNHNWSQQELADLLGTTPVTISRWETGVSAPSPYFRLKLEKLFGKSFETLELEPEEEAVEEDEQLVNNASLEVDTSSYSNASESPGQPSSDQDDTVEVSAGEQASALALQPQQRRLSRRNATLLLIGGGVAIAASVGTVWLIEASAAHTANPAHASPTITTLYTYKPAGYNVNFVVWSPRGSLIACANGDNTVQILDAATGYVKMVYRKHTSYANCVTWDPDATRVASASGDGTVQVWKPTTGEQILTYTGHIGPVYCATWSPDGTRIASGGKDATVQIWDAFTGQHMTTYQGHSMGVWNIVWSPADKQTIASGGEDGTIQIWDARSLQKSPTFVYQGPHSRINEIDWSPDGHLIASAHIDATVRIWDPQTGSAMLTYRGHTTSVLTARWSPDGTYIASGSEDGMVHIWNASTGNRIFSYNKHTNAIFEVSWAPDGKRLATAGADQTMYVCEMNF